MDNLIKDNECILLGAVMHKPAANATWLHKLIAMDYKFSEEYQKLSSYLLEKSFELSNGEIINKHDCCQKTGLTTEQYAFFLLQGEQDLKPSFEYLVENKRLSELTALFTAFSSKSKRTVQDFEQLKTDIQNIEVLREFKTHEQIDENIAQMIDSITEGKTKLYPTPFDTWDQTLKGINPEDLIVVGAYSGSGKTHFAIQMTLSILNAGGRTMFISAENSEEEIKTRFGAHIAKVYETSIYDADSDRCMQLVSGIKTIGDTYGDNLTIARMRDFDDILTVMKARSVANLDDFYVLDYMQLFTCKRKFGSEREQIADFSNSLVDFVGKYKKPVLVLSQLTKGETESFKGAQELLNMATVAGFIFKSREIETEEYTKKNFYRVKVDFKKVRRGSLFTVYGKVYPSDPAIKEVNTINEDLELWNLEPKKYR